MLAGAYPIGLSPPSCHNFLLTPRVFNWTLLANTCSLGLPVGFPFITCRARRESTVSYKVGLHPRALLPSHLSTALINLWAGSSLRLYMRSPIASSSPPTGPSHGLRLLRRVSPWLRRFACRQKVRTVNQDSSRALASRPTSARTMLIGQ